MNFSAPVANKVNFTSLGCPRNLVDSEVMLGILLKAGYEVVQQIEEADYLVVNTCAFLESSRQESKEAIQSLLETKKKEAKLIVTGCMVTKHRQEIEETFPGVHYLLGAGDVEGILQAVRSDIQGSQIGTVRSYLEAGEVPRMLSTPKHYAYLKIAEGCRKACAYCVIPKIKGPLRSKEGSQVLKEFKALLQQGVREVILIAQDLGDYGKDLFGQKKSEALVKLLRQMLEVEGDYWIRLLYLYPDEITDELIELIQQDARICAYLDMPIQHINDTLLKAMRRQTTGDEIKAILTTLRQKIPSIHIRTSLIVGFPGETEEQFEELCAFVKDYSLHHIGIFKYSKEEGTPAGKMSEQIDAATKERRFETLAAIQQEVVEELYASMIGTTVDAIVEGYHPETKLLMVGRYFGQCPDIDGQILINDGRKVSGFGKRYRVEITDSAGYDLVGRVTSALDAPSKKSERSQRSKFNLLS